MAAWRVTGLKLITLGTVGCGKRTLLHSFTLGRDPHRHGDLTTPSGLEHGFMALDLRVPKASEPEPNPTPASAQAGDSKVNAKAGSTDAGAKPAAAAAAADVVMRMTMWQTAGQERFSPMSPSYLRGAHITLLCYDVNDRKSFDAVDLWHAQWMQARARARDRVVAFTAYRKQVLALTDAAGQSADASARLPVPVCDTVNDAALMCGVALLLGLKADDIGTAQSTTAASKSAQAARQVTFAEGEAKALALAGVGRYAFTECSAKSMRGVHRAIRRALNVLARSTTGMPVSLTAAPPAGSIGGSGWGCVCM